MRNYRAGRPVNDCEVGRFDRRSDYKALAWFIGWLRRAV